jgi:hypothetical protein
MPVIILNSSPDISVGLPLPGDPTLIAPGLLLAYATNAATVVAGNDGCTTITKAADDGCDGCDIPNEIEIEFLVERRVDRVRRFHKEERVSIRGRVDHLSLAAANESDVAPATKPKPAPSKSACAADMSAAAFEAVTGALVTALDLGGSAALAFLRVCLHISHEFLDVLGRKILSCQRHGCKCNSGLGAGTPPRIIGRAS